MPPCIAPGRGVFRLTFQGIEKRQRNATLAGKITGCVNFPKGLIEMRFPVLLLFTVLVATGRWTGHAAEPSLVITIGG
jgi:hypothetical protein